MTAIQQRLKAKLLIVPCRPHMLETARNKKIGG